MQNYNKTLPSWSSLLLFDIVALGLIGLNIYQIISTWGQTDSGFGFIIWAPSISGLLAIIGITHLSYIKRHMKSGIKRTVLQIVFLICLAPFLLLVLLFMYSILQGGLAVRQ